MTVEFLGTGTSHGVPFIACECPTCISSNPKNKRLRASVLVTHGNKNILIDASSDFRQQALRSKIRDIYAILITHVHADHVFGLDEMRRFNEMYQKSIALYCEEYADAQLRQVFYYMYGRLLQRGGGVSNLDNQIISAGTKFFIDDLEVLPIRIGHGKLDILGYRIGKFAYLTDCKTIPHASMELLKGLDYLVLSALRHNPHTTHASLSDSVASAKNIAAKQTYFTHMSHDLEHEATNASLPKSMELAYDGLKININ